MSRPVDPDLLSRFVLRETTDAEAAEVHRLVAESPAWAEELRLQAALDVTLYEAFDVLRARSHQVSRGPSLLDRLRRLMVPVAPVLVAAAALLWVASSDVPPSYALEVYSGESEVRAASQHGQRYTRGSSLDLVLRADTPTPAEPDVSLTLDGHPLHGAQVRYVEGGSILIRGVFGETLPEPAPGPHLLIITVAGTRHTLDLQWEAPR